MARIQVVIDEAEREQFRARANAEGMSLSEWLREAGRQRMAAARPARLVTEEQMHDFFADLDEQRAATGDHQPEEDWEVIKARLDATRRNDLDPLGLDP